MTMNMSIQGDDLHHERVKKKTKHNKKKNERISNEEAADNGAKTNDDKKKKNPKKNNRKEEKYEGKYDERFKKIEDEEDPNKNNNNGVNVSRESLDIIENEKDLDNGIIVESMKDKKKKQRKDKSKSSSEKLEVISDGGFNKVEDEEALNRKKQFGEEKTVEFESAKDLKKKRKKDKNDKTKVGMSSSPEEILHGVESGEYIRTKELGSNETEEVFDDAVGMEGDAIVEKTEAKIKDKEKKKEKKYKGTKDSKMPIDTEKTVYDDKEVTHHGGHSNLFSEKKRCRDDGVERQSDKKMKKAKLVKDLREGVDEREERNNSKEEIDDYFKLSKTKKSRKRVTFSDNDEVFPPPEVKDAGKGNQDTKFTEEEDKTTEDAIEENQEVQLVRGKKFRKDEDEAIKAAVYKYIEEHGLGNEGLKMVLHCSRYPQVRRCWFDISAALPNRPRLAIYSRAHILFERGEIRKWTDEEKELIRKFYETNGADWRTLADELGKNRVHLKDTWRRIKLPNLKKGHWSQEEYQTLFDLVNKDLQMKVFEEKKTQHGMLRENICFEAISTRLSTRTNSQCCFKWYNQLRSRLAREGVWEDADDYRLMNALLAIDVSCEEDVNWDNLLEYRSGDVCRKRWNQMVRHLGEHGNKPFPDQVEVLAQRYCPNLLEAKEIIDNKVPVS